MSTTVSFAQFNIDNVCVGQPEEKQSKDGTPYKSSKIEYKHPHRIGKLNFSSYEMDPQKGNSIIFCGARLTKVIKYGTKDQWTGDYQLAIPLYQNPKVPSSDEIKYVDDLKQIRRKVAVELVAENGADSSKDEIEESLKKVKDMVTHKLLYVKGPDGNPILLKSGKKKVAGVDDSKSPTLYVKLYTRDCEPQGEDGRVRCIGTKFVDMNMNQIQNPEELIGKLLDCVVVLSFDSVYISKGLSIQAKVSEVGIVRVRDSPSMRTSALEGFNHVLAKQSLPDSTMNDRAVDDDSDDDDSN